MDPAITPLVIEIIKQGGLSAVIIVLLLIIRYLANDTKDERERNRKLQELRLEETKAALQSVASAVATVQAAIDLINRRVRR
jgi:hypothetical protein